MKIYDKVKEVAQYFKDQQPARWAIGIDPGTNCGLGVWDMQEMRLNAIYTLSTMNAMDMVLEYANRGGCMVLVEDARLRKHFGDTGRERLQGAGWAKAASKQWEDFLKHYKILYRMQKPGSTWKGAAAGKTWASITKWKGKTSDHARDAAWLVFEMSRTKMEVLCGVMS